MLPTIPEVTIYTDGAASPTRGAGGYGAVLLWGERRKEISGPLWDVTNQMAELWAAIEALNALDCKCKVTLITDSKYLQLGLTHWVTLWLARNWRTRSGTAVANQDLWKTLYKLSHHHRIQVDWVKGHSGNEHNHRADRLAHAARLQAKQAEA